MGGFHSGLRFVLPIYCLSDVTMPEKRPGRRPDDVRRPLGWLAQALCDAIDAYREAAGHFPWADEAARHLRIWVRPADQETLGDTDYERREIEDLLMQACLQLVASRLLNQMMQEGTAERDLYFALEQMRELDAERNKRLASLVKPDRTRRKKGKRPAAEANVWDE
jgi:hypothetical protein